MVVAAGAHGSHFHDAPKVTRAAHELLQLGCSGWWVQVCACGVDSDSGRHHQFLHKGAAAFPFLIGDAAAFSFLVGDAATGIINSSLVMLLPSPFSLLLLASSIPTQRCCCLLISRCCCSLCCLPFSRCCCCWHQQFLYEGVPCYYPVHDC